jgi:hypothetical protein
VLLLVPLMFLTSPIEAFHGRETRAERVSKKTDRLPDELIFPTRSLGSPNNERRRRIYKVYISSAKNEKRANNALHK